MLFRVNRNKWRTGSFSPVQTGSGQTSLLNPYGWMCCLGHCMLCEGFKPIELYERDFPCLVELIQTGKSIFNTSEEGRKLACVAAQINDDTNTTVQEKEQRLTVLFQSYGHTIEFYDGEA